jgi:hypothetical protein
MVARRLLLWLLTLLAAQAAMNDAPSTTPIPNRTSFYNASVV